MGQNEAPGGIGEGIVGANSREDRQSHFPMEKKTCSRIKVFVGEKTFLGVGTEQQELGGSRRKVNKPAEGSERVVHD